MDAALHRVNKTVPSARPPRRVNKERWYATPQLTNQWMNNYLKERGGSGPESGPYPPMPLAAAFVREASMVAEAEEEIGVRWQYGSIRKQQLNPTSHDSKTTRSQWTTPAGPWLTHRYTCDTDLRRSVAKSVVLEEYINIIIVLL